MVKHVPNFITLLNLLSGCIATVFAVGNQIELAAVFVGLGIFFDFFDGLAARLLNVKSDLGLQLDSLADMVTSGLVPGVVMYQLIRKSVYNGWGTETVGFLQDSAITLTGLLPLVGFTITLASAYRLAKFNIDENQTTSFIGLPTPANAILILSLPLIVMYHGNDWVNNLILNVWFLLTLTALSAFLLNSSLELFALKFTSWGFKENVFRYLFIGASIVLILILGFISIPAIILLYILLSIIITK